MKLEKSKIGDVFISFTEKVFTHIQFGPNRWKLSVTLTTSPSRLQFLISSFEHELGSNSFFLEFAFGVEHMVGSRQFFFKRQGEPGLLLSVLSDLPSNTCKGREWSYVVEIQIDECQKCREKKKNLSINWSWPPEHQAGTLSMYQATLPPLIFLSYRL